MNIKLLQKIFDILSDIDLQFQAEMTKKIHETDYEILFWNSHLTYFRLKTIVRGLAFLKTKAVLMSDIICLLFTMRHCFVSK